MNPTDYHQTRMAASLGHFASMRHSRTVCHLSTTRTVYSIRNLEINR
jgi:hypothetical protein